MGIGDSMKLSLCMIVRDEEAVLARCLQGVAPYVDEVVIADTGSTDRTAEIAKSFGCKLFSFAWRDDFSAARNFCFDNAQGDYLLWLDADDYISEENGVRLLALKKQIAEEAPDTVMCPYAVSFSDDGRPAQSFLRERILKNRPESRFRGRVHECAAPWGKIINSDFTVFHLGSQKSRGARNLHIYQKWMKEEGLSGRDAFYYGRELYYNGLYTEAVAVLEEMLRGDGWYVNKIEACKITSLCYLARGDKERALEALFRSFLFGEPRAGVLCAIASICYGAGQLKEAAFFYESALLARSHVAEGDFEEATDLSLTPLLQLTCIYHALGEKERAVGAHLRAEALFPDHPAVQYNRRYYEEKGWL